MKRICALLAVLTLACALTACGGTGAQSKQEPSQSTPPASSAPDGSGPAARPAVSGVLENPDSYDIVFLGYPIWWGQAPKILYTFLESYDFGDAAMVPFCTSGSSGIGSSADGLQELAVNARWLEGQRFSGSASESTVAAWVEDLDLLPSMEEKAEGPALHQ